MIEYEPAASDKPKVRVRKPTSAARIEVSFWFINVETYYKFASVPFARKAKTVTEREWLGAWDQGDGSVTAHFAFTHTCRNSGGQNSDTERFFQSTCNAAGVAWWADACVMVVELVSRDTSVPQENLVERWRLGDFYVDPQRNPDLAHE